MGEDRYPKINKIVKPIHSSVALSVIMFVFCILALWGLMLYMLRKKRIATDFHWAACLLIIIAAIWCMCQYVADGVSIKNACLLADNILQNNNTIISLVKTYKVPNFTSSYLINILNSPSHNILPTMADIVSYYNGTNFTESITGLTSSMSSIVQAVNGLKIPFDSTASQAIYNNISNSIFDLSYEVPDAIQAINALNAITDNSDYHALDQWVYNINNCKADYDTHQNVLTPLSTPPTKSCFKIGVCNTSALSTRYASHSKLSDISTVYGRIYQYTTNTVVIYNGFDAMINYYLSTMNQIPNCFTNKVVNVPGPMQVLVDQYVENISNTTLYNMTLVYNFTVYAKSLICESTYSMVACASMLAIIIIFLAGYMLCIGYLGRLVKDTTVTAFTSTEAEPLTKDN